jgi:hypothetical protein
MDKKLSILDTIPAVDRSTDLLYIVDVSAGTPNKVTINAALGISGAPVGTTDSQTLTNKTLTTPTVSSPVLSGTITGTYTLGGTPTFPASVATLTGTQTLTNKTLTSPTINTATIANPTLTVDTISEFTGNNGVSIDGLNIKDGALVGAVIKNANLDTTAGELGAAWTTYTPTITSQSGTATTIATNSAKSKKIGKTLFVFLDITITNKGTATGYMRITLPYTPLAGASVTGAGAEKAGTGVSLSVISRLSGSIDVSRFDNGTTYANGYQNIINVTYEIA